MIRRIMRAVQSQLRSLIVVIGLVVIASTITPIVALSTTVSVTAEQILSHYWRSTYDILVRPAGSHSLVEEEYRLVETNHLSGIWGGISISQYEAIRSIPEVEVAAPVAMLGYITLYADMEPIGQLNTRGAYALRTTRIVDDGARILHQVSSVTLYYVGTDAPSPNPGASPSELFKGECSFNFNPPFPVRSIFYIPLLMAGIDPEQEAALVGLDRAIIKGAYLSATERPVVREEEHPVLGHRFVNIEAPALVNETPYISATFRSELIRFDIPPEQLSWEAIEKGGCAQYLQAFPTTTLAVQVMDTQALYQQMAENSMRHPLGLEQAMGSPGVSLLTEIPGRIDYRVTKSPISYDGLVLEIVPYGEQWAPEGERAYRPRSESGSHKLRTSVSLRVRGIFDIGTIPQPADVSRVPLETYTPPVSILRYDENGNSVEPRPLRPTFNIGGYIQPPPFILIPLEAARMIAGDDCISAIRVRVGGIDELTPQAQRKIEAVASEIHRRTGLDVDIMVGSSPRRILVHVPGIGYVEEQWVQKNVTLSYHRRIQSGHLLLIVALLVTGGLFAADMAWADLLARQPVLALQKALGWRSATLMGHVLRRALLVGAGAGLSGTALAAGALALARQPLPSLPWLAGVPLLVTTLSLLGSLYPALQAARVPPIPLLRMAGLRHRPGRERVRGRSGGVLLSARYALRGVVRRWSRSLLAGMTAALSAGLLVLLVGVVVDRAGYLSGTLLGEYILVQVEGYHWWLVGVGMALAAAGMGNSLLAGVLERRREIGVLKALGWRTGAVARLFLLEGAMLGLLGGLAGTALGLAVYLGLYRSVGAGLLWAVLAGLGVPTLVGVLAAAYPARVAAGVAPAEAVRGE
jgi:hypothetical protein